MTKLFILLFLFAAYFYKAQIYPSSCNKLDTITNYYSEDAKKLNFRFIHRSGNTYKDSIALNPIITNGFHRALLAVYNATAIPARDSIVGLLKIHTFNPFLHQILVEADSNLQWMKNLRANVTPTGNYTVDSLINKHYLKKFSYMTFPSVWYAYLVLESDTTLNMLALKNFISRLPGVHIAAYDDYRAGEDENIEDTVNANFHWFRYTYGWGDCESGCFFHRYWQFRVYNDCSVEYGGSYGYPLNVGIKQNAIVFEDLKAYPNPVSGMLNLEGLPEKAKLFLINVLGEEIYSGNGSTGFVALDLSMYASGIYYLKVRNDIGQQIIKVVKN